MSCGCTISLIKLGTVHSLHPIGGLRVFGWISLMSSRSSEPLIMQAVSNLSLPVVVCLQ